MRATSPWEETPQKGPELREHIGNQPSACTIAIVFPSMSRNFAFRLAQGM